MNQLNLDFPLEVKSSTNDGMIFEGYGSVFNNRDYHDDVIEPGAFAASLRQSKKSGQWPSMLLQHGGSMFGSAEDQTPIGIWTDMAEDGNGLWVQGKLADTTRGRDIYALLKMEPRPAITGLSIGFFVKEMELGTKPKEPRRKIKAVDLVEVSIVTMPANPKARITGVKSAAEMCETERHFEKLLRDLGFSRSAALAITSSGFKAYSTLRDADGNQADKLLAKLREANSTLKTICN